MPQNLSFGMVINNTTQNVKGRLNNGQNTIIGRRKGGHGKHRKQKVISSGQAVLWLTNGNAFTTTFLLFRNIASLMYDFWLLLDAISTNLRSGSYFWVFWRLPYIQYLMLKFLVLIECNMEGMKPTKAKPKQQNDEKTNKKKYCENSTK